MAQSHTQHSETPSAVPVTTQHSEREPTEAEMIAWFEAYHYR